MKLLIFEDIGQHFLGHVIKRAPLLTEEMEGPDQKSRIRAGLMKSQAWPLRREIEVWKYWQHQTGFRN